MRSSHPQQPRNLFLLTLLGVLCLYTALTAWLPLRTVDGQQYISVLGAVNYAGFLAVVGCSVSYVAFRQFFMRALGITLLAALFNLLSFLPFTTSVGITVADVRLGINPLVLVLLLVFYSLNRPAANTFIRKYLVPAPTPQQAARQHREAIDQFKQTFARKPNDALQQIVRERKLVANAIAAAQELLAERGVLPLAAS